MLLFHKKSLQISREAFKYIFRLHQNYSSPECEITPVIIIEEIIINLNIVFLYSGANVDKKLLSTSFSIIFFQKTNKVLLDATIRGAARQNISNLFLKDNYLPIIGIRCKPIIAQYIV